MEYKARLNGASSIRNLGGQYNNMNYSSSLNNKPMTDAASEKEQGNGYFKHKKFAEAIDCYSRSIGLSPTAVAFANRAMAYLKLRRQVTLACCVLSAASNLPCSNLQPYLLVSIEIYGILLYTLIFCDMDFIRFKEAEDDCTEALDLDDRYIKVYSRRITARKELGKLKEAMDDCTLICTDAEFAISLDPNNPGLRKQYSEIKALHMEITKKASVPAKRAVSGFDKTADKKDKTSHPWTISRKPQDGKQKAGSEASIQELASRAASLYMSSTVKSVKTPKTAYDFEVSWRALSDDTAQQIQLLKSIPPASLPEIFKNSLSAAFLVDIVKCSASIFRICTCHILRDDGVLAVSFLENLAKVPRFDLIIMCLSSINKSELRKILDQIFLDNASTDQKEILRQLQAPSVSLRCPTPSPAPTSTFTGAHAEFICILPLPTLESSYHLLRSACSAFCSTRSVLP
ncbi:hypothetical protein PR202_gb24999 [Eleusine coracana subsp. coracana]|uniref:RNA-polymerase II-associated protein 3-like C-terminal domain-containing protein n=1 Tax=Eleusine coracana subsp. coracana TaxID=191504 RepID=A0AAV5FK71_ELECO|nr:hypothetical protein PR202_gb24999 [Eleusine coracana subsp. coracana]